MQRRWWGLSALGLVVISCGLAWSQGRCMSAWWHWRLQARECPAGTPRMQLRLDASDVQRGQQVDAVVTVRAAVLDADAAWPDDVALHGIPVLPYEPDALDLSLVPADAPADALSLDCDWEDLGQARYGCSFTLPEDLADGRYALTVRASSRLPEPAELAVPVAFFRPSTSHLLTDRPLYEPGDVVQLRSLSLDRFTGVPLAAREGRMEIRDAEGRRVFLEDLVGSDWGVASTSLPLPADAPVGTWKARLFTGDETAETTFVVKAYELPTVTVDAHGSRTWFAPGQRVVLNGTVRAWSGVPLTGAEVQVTVPPAAGWPPPTAWTEGATTTTDADGAWEIDLGPVPDDLVGAAALIARVDATAPSGERVATALPLALSADPVVADGLTELGGGLVPAEPNRIWLRLTTPDGRPLAHREVEIGNPWDELGAAVAARTDADGVAAVLLDPGNPVSLVEPRQPVRMPIEIPTEDPVLVHDARALAGATDDLVARLLPAARAASAACGWRIEERDRTGFVVHALGGRVRTVTPRESPLERCLADALGDAALPAGLYAVTLSLQPPATRTALALEQATGPDEPGVVGTAAAVLERGRQEALACLQDRAGTAEIGRQPLPVAVHWTLPEGGRHLRTSLLPLSPERWAEEACIERTFTRVAAAEPVWTEEEERVAAATHQGMQRFTTTVHRPGPVEEETDGPTVSTGFELEIAVADVGRTTWRSRPGKVPRLRLRPAQSIVAPGETFTVAALRGPTHRGALPDTITMQSGDAPQVECPRTAAVAAAWAKAERALPDACPQPDDDATFTLRAPEGRSGFLALEAGGARAVVLVRGGDGHELQLSTDAATYRPGRTATLTVQTGQPAVVSLTGIDQAIGQLATLPAADSLTRRTLPVAESGRVFGGIDAFALASGAVQGEHAALAALHRLSLRPATPPTPKPQPVDAAQRLPLDAELTVAFWSLTDDVRQAAPRLPRPITLPAYAALWDQLAAEHPDPFGAPLTLDRLSPELLEAADPRNVVADGALLPEDVEPWLPWVRRNPDRPAMAQVIP